MRDDERADGGQFCERVRPGLGGEGSGEVVEHVVARVVAERHEERGEEDRALAALPEKGAQAVRRADKDVGAAAGSQCALELGKRGLAFRTAMTGKDDEVVGARGDGLVKRCGNGDMVRCVREQGRSKTETVEAESGGVHGGRSLAMEPSVDDVRRHHEDATRAGASQVIERVWQRRAHGPTARAGADHRARANRRREPIHERSHARVALLAGEAARYDQRVEHASGGRRAPRP